MSVYFIASYDVEDAEAHERYVMAADPLLEKHGGELLVADDEARTLEGKGRLLNVVVKFNSETAAMNFYDDPDYRSIKQIRHNATSNGTLMLAKEFVLPGM